MAAFIIFIIVLGIAYLIIWTPFVNNLNREVSIAVLTQVAHCCLDMENQINANNHTNRGYFEDSAHSRIPTQPKLLPKQGFFLRRELKCDSKHFKNRDSMIKVDVQALSQYLGLREARVTHAIWHLKSYIGIKYKPVTCLLLL